MGEEGVLLDTINEADLEDAFHLAERAFDVTVEHLGAFRVDGTAFGKRECLDRHDGSLRSSGPRCTDRSNPCD